MTENKSEEFSRTPSLKTGLSPLPFLMKRIFARFTDYLVWGIISALIIMPFFERGMLSLETAAVVYSLMFAVYPALEAALTARFKSTLGGWLTGVSVESAEGEKLTFKAALKRAYLVYVLGFGLFLPLLSVICPLVMLYFALNGKELPWDSKTASRVSFYTAPVGRKVALAVFYVLFLIGFAMGAHAYYRFTSEQDLTEEDEILVSYLQEAQPLMQTILSQDALTTPESVTETAANLENLQQLIIRYREEYENIYAAQLKKIEAMPESKRIDAFHAMDSRAEDLRMFWFAQSLRISILQNIVSFFIEADGKYKFENGQPVFEDPELMQAYKDFIARISSAPAEEVDANGAEVVPQAPEGIAIEISEDGVREIAPNE